MLRFPTVLEAPVDRNYDDRRDRRVSALVLKMRAKGGTGYVGLSPGDLRSSKVSFHLTPHEIPAD